MMKTEIEVIEAYKNWRPPFNVRQIVQEMLAFVPNEYLAGLQKVVFVNTDVFNHSEKRQKKRIDHQTFYKKDCLGFYYNGDQNSGAWIELIVDNMLNEDKNYPLWMPLSKDITIGLTLFHEIGHDIHKNIRPEHQDKETTADSWRNKLMVGYIQQKYKSLLFAALLIRVITKIIPRSQKQREFEKRQDELLKRRSKD